MKKILVLPLIILAFMLSSCASKQEKSAKGVPSPEYGGIYLYCSNCQLTYQKLTPLPTIPTGYSATRAIDKTAVFAFIIYDSKDPRDTYDFYHFPRATANGLDAVNNFEPAVPKITVFKASDNNNYYYIELYNPVSGEVYGVKNKQGVIFSPFFMQP